MAHPAYRISLSVRLATLVAAGLIAAVAGIARAENCTMKRLVELPMIANETSSPAVSITVDGQPRTMLLDTGGFWSLLSPPVAAGLMGRKFGNVGWLGLDGIPLTTVVRAPSVQIGPAKVENVDFLVSPPQYGSYDGTLGANWLKVFDVEIDPVRNTASLFSQDHCPGQVVYWPHQDLAEVPVNIDRIQKWITVPLVLNDRQIDALIDTGAPETVISFAAAERLFGLTPSSPGMERMSMTDQSGRAREAYRYQFKSLQMGDISFRNPWILVTRVAHGPEMILGMHHLHGLHLYFAYGEGKLYATSAQGDIGAGQPPRRGTQGTASGTTDPLATVNARDLVQIAVADIQKKDTAGAMAAIDRAVEADPNSSAAYVLRAGLESDAHNTDLAFRDLDAAIRCDPKNGAAYAARGQLHWSQKNLNGAYVDINRALELNPNFVPGYLLRAELNTALHQMREATDDASQAIALQPSNVMAYLERAHVSEESGNYPSAVEDADKAVRLQPKLAFALGLRCEIQMKARNYGAAIADCNAAIALDPRNVGYLQTRGLVHLRSALYRLAIDDYDAALAVVPDLPGALYGRGLAKQQTGDIKGGALDMVAARKINSEIGHSFEE